MTRKLIMVVLMCLMAFQAMATSAYYINRTDSPIRVSLITDTTAPVEEGNQYHLPEHNPQGVLVIQPYQKVKLATFNRYYGIIKNLEQGLSVYFRDRNVNKKIETDI